MESNSEEIEECSVCFHNFNFNEKRPKILPCMHTLCYSCLSILKFTEFTDASTSGLKRGECPFCRQYFLSNAIQDNRYILAHMNHVRRRSYVDQATPSAPEESAVFDGVRMTSLKWCLDCEKVFREDNCTSHLWLPLIQVLESKKESSRNVIKDLETKIQTLSSSVEEMGNIFENIFSSFKETLKEFEDIHENTETLKNLIVDLKQMYTNIQTPTDEASILLHVNLCKDLGDSCNWLTDFMTNMETKIVSNRLTWGQFDMLTEHKKFTVSSSSDDSSFEIILKKKGEISLLNNKRF